VKNHITRSPDDKGWIIHVVEPVGKLRLVPPREGQGTWWRMVDDNDETFIMVNPKGVQRAQEG
jgi:hypothetical protein